MYHEVTVIQNIMIKKFKPIFQRHDHMSIPNYTFKNIASHDLICEYIS